MSKFTIVALPAKTYECKIPGLYPKILFLTYFKIYLNEAAKKQHTTISAFLAYFLSKNEFLASMGVLQL